MKYWPDSPHKLAVNFIVFALICSAVLANVSHAQVAPAQPLLGERESEVAFRRVSNRLLCQCGCNYMVLSCNHLDCPSATYIRKTIKTSLADGMSEDVIVANFVDQYGVQILPEPPLHGFSLMAWVMPFLALLLGGGGVSYVLWQWKWKPPDRGVSDTGESVVLPAIGQKPRPELVEKYRSQIEGDLEKE